jgi:hypothetical protein
MNADALEALLKRFPPPPPSPELIARVAAIVRGWAEDDAWRCAQRTRGSDATPPRRRKPGRSPADPTRATDENCGQR